MKIDLSRVRLTEDWHIYPTFRCLSGLLLSIYCHLTPLSNHQKRLSKPRRVNHSATLRAFFEHTSNSRFSKTAFKTTMAPRSEDLFDEDDAPSINPYEVLGIEKTATAGEVKTAYRKAALKNHPGT